MSDWRSRITVEPGKLGGKPCVRGMRISVADVLEYLAADMSTEEILADFPYLERKDILACLAYAAERERGPRHSLCEGPSGDDCRHEACGAMKARRIICVTARRSLA